MASFTKKVHGYLDDRRYLIPAIIGLSGACHICRGAVRREPPESICTNCSDPEIGVFTSLGFGVYVIRGAQTAHEFYSYKGDNADSKGPAIQVLTCLAYLGILEACNRSNMEISCITIVPSLSGRRDPHPLSDIVTSATQKIPTAPPVRQLLQGAAIPKDRRRDEEAAHFSVSNKITEYNNILLVDDTWVSGGHMKSAAKALKNQGAKTVTGLALGRWINPEDTRFTGKQILETANLHQSTFAHYRFFSDYPVATQSFQLF